MEILGRPDRFGIEDVIRFGDRGESLPSGSHLAVDDIGGAVEVPVPDRFCDQGAGQQLARAFSRPP
jgi:hypothetical protein